MGIKLIEVPELTAEPIDNDDVVDVIETAPDVAVIAAEVVIVVFASKVKLVAAVTALDKLMLVVLELIEIEASESMVPPVGFVISVEPEIVTLPVASIAPDIATVVPPDIDSVPPCAVKVAAPL